MNMIKKIMKNNWDFTLYQVNEELVFTVVFHSSRIDFSRSFQLVENEKNFDFEGLKKLSEQIRNNYEVFKDREIIPAITTESPR